jgi:hypothetical protein
MNLFNKFDVLSITKKLRFGAHAKMDVNGTEIDLTELAALNSLSATELGYLDGVTAGTALASKAVVLDSSKDVTGVRVVSGTAAAQGVDATLKGGTSSTSGNAGGAAKLTGGTPGATGIGGAAEVTGAAGGATSGAGGAATIAAGAGTAGNSAGGIGSVTGGAGQGSAAGGIGKTVGGQGGATGVGGKGQVIGGAGGATSGKGGAAEVTGGAGTAGNGSGGSVIITGGAKNGSGLDGGIFQRATSYFRKQSAQVDKADGAETITAAQMINGIVVFTVTTGRTLTTPTGAAILAGCPTDIAAGDSFDLTVITVGSGADDIATLTAGDADVTFVGNVTVGPDSSTFNGYGTWRFRYTGANAFVGYRIG